MVRIAIRVDGNQDEGWRLERCLAIAAGVMETGGENEVIFLSSGGNTSIIEKRGFSWKEIENSNVAELDCEATALAVEQENTDILLVDSRNINEHYLEKLGEKVRKLAVIDDLMSLKSYPADILINPAINAHLLPYESEGELLLGTEFALLAEEFDQYQEFKRQTEEKAGRIVVHFRGTDFRRGTIAAVAALKSVQENFSCTIITGMGFKGGEELAREIGLDGRFIVIGDESSLPRKLAAADMAVVSPASLSELLFFKLPCILMAEEDCQADAIGYMARNGMAVSGGNANESDIPRLKDKIKQLMGSKAERKRMSARMEDLVDGLGRFRIAEELLRT